MKFLDNTPNYLFLLEKVVWVKPLFPVRQQLSWLKKEKSFTGEHRSSF